jgi:uncharacterized RDD family membrane protein YckC
VTKTCSQCGAVLPAGTRVCQFCDSSFSLGFSAIVEPSVIPQVGIPSRNENTGRLGIHSPERQASFGTEGIQGSSWRGELAERFRANRTRRGKTAENDGQAHFSFEDSPVASEATASIAIEEETPNKEDFSFTVAIGKPAKTNPCEELPMEIDVSSSLNANGQAQTQPEQIGADCQPGLYPVASFDDRRLAGLIDFFCLAFAYGGFLGLFCSLGGHFTLSKLSAVVCVTTFAVVYMQYFALFTIFGGTTPGMMLRGLQVVSFSGEPPTPKQMLLRSVGYLLSAGTFFLGFLWAMWDSDELTWHDRLSQTYLSIEQTLPELEASDAAHGR